MIDYAKTKWAAVNRICRRFEGYKARQKIHMHLGKWTGLEADPHVTVSAHLESPEDVARLVSVLGEIAGVWPKEVSDDTER